MAGTRCAGIDWASEAHEVCISDEGIAIERFATTHDEQGIADLTQRLLKLGVDRVAIERPDGILVERLLAAGLEVLAIHPNQLKAARPRYAVAHGKSDRFDAFVLAELARTDAHRFPALRTRSRRDEGPANPHPLARGSCRGQGRAGQSVARPTGGVLAWRPDLRRRRLPDLPRLHRSLPEPRGRQGIGRRSGWPPSWPATAIAGAPIPPSWWPGSTRPQGARRAGGARSPPECGARLGRGA